MAVSSEMQGIESVSLPRVRGEAVAVCFNKAGDLSGL